MALRRKSKRFSHNNPAALCEECCQVATGQSTPDASGLLWSDEDRSRRPSLCGAESFGAKMSVAFTLILYYVTRFSEMKTSVDVFSKKYYLIMASIRTIITNQWRKVGGADVQSIRLRNMALIWASQAVSTSQQSHVCTRHHVQHQIIGPKNHPSEPKDSKSTAMPLHRIWPIHLCQQNNSISKLHDKVGGHILTKSNCPKLQQYINFIKQNLRFIT